MRLLVYIFYLRFIIDLSDQQLIFLIKTRVLIVTSLKKCEILVYIRLHY